MPTFPFRPEPLRFDAARRPGGAEVGCVHPDGSITYRGRRYRDIRQVPGECPAFRADLPSTLRWRRLYRAVDPRRGRLQERDE
jgi:hypothetical protein